MKVFRRSLSLLAALALLLSLSSIGSIAFAAGSGTVTIFHTNDSHGAGVEGGKLSSVLRFSQAAELRAKTTNSLLVDAGDITQGDVFATLTEGLASINAMRLAGYDVITLGNHEFTGIRDNVLDNFTAPKDAPATGGAEALALAGATLQGNPIPIVNANVTGAPKLEALPQNHTVTVGGVKVGFFGLITPSTYITASPSSVVGLTFGDVVAAAQAQVTALELAGCDVIVALAHLGYEASASAATDITSNAVAEHVAGIDVIIDGHAHLTMMEGSAVKVNDTLIVSTGSSMAAIGQVDLTVTAGVVTSAVSKKVAPGTDKAEDTTVKAYLDGVNTRVNALVGEVFAHSSMALYGGNYANAGGAVSIARRGETNLNSLINDARIEAAQAYIATHPSIWPGGDASTLPIVAMWNGGSVRATIPAGDITYKQVMSCFLGTTGGGYYAVIEGRVLWEAIEWGLSSLLYDSPAYIAAREATGTINADGGFHGRFPNLGGLSYTYDITKTPSTPINYGGTGAYTVGTRLTSITLGDGTEITKDSTTKIFFVTDSYNLSGGDGYWCLPQAIAATPARLELLGDLGISAYEALIKKMKEMYAATGDVYYPLSTDRVTVTGGYTASSFTSKVKLVDRDNAVIPNTIASVYINHGTAGGVNWVKTYEGVTDAGGQLSVSGLQNGPQEIRVALRDGSGGVVYSDVKLIDNYAGLVNSLNKFNIVRDSLRDFSSLGVSILEPHVWIFEPFHFEATGPSVPSPVAGDVRWVPVSYDIASGGSGTFSGPPYVGSSSIAAGGRYPMRVLFKAQVFDGAIWTDNGSRYTKTLTITPLQRPGGAAPAAGTPSPATGDSADVAMLVLTLTISLAGAAVLLKKRRARG